jgi:hypothetical protein
MFNLDEAIGQWRGTMACGGACTSSDLDELETHVRDQIDHLLSANLTEEEAFSVALHRLGNPEALRVEYAKMNPAGLWRERLFWMLAGILGLWLISALATGMSSVCTLGGLMAGVQGGALGAVQAGSYALAFACLVWLCITTRHAAARWTSAHVIGRSRSRYVAVVALLLGVILAGRLTSGLSHAFVSRWVGSQQLGQMAIVQTYISLSTSVVLSVVIVVAAASLLRGREPQQASTCA